jgi:hypothetical protein
VIINLRERLKKMPENTEEKYSENTREKLTKNTTKIHEKSYCETP